MKKVEQNETNKTVKKINIDKEAKKAVKKAGKKSFKTITMWAIIDNDNPDTPVTFTATREDALLALDQYLYLKHYKHFRLWCPIHGYTVDHGAAWVAYSKTAIDAGSEENPRYTLARLEYEPNTLASIIRQYYGCIPMGCPFDTDDELNGYSNYLADKAERVLAGEEQFTPIEEALDFLFDDLEAQNVAEHADDADNSCPSRDAYDA